MKVVSRFGFMTYMVCIGNVLIFKCTMALKVIVIVLKKRNETPGQRLDLHIYATCNA